MSDCLGCENNGNSYSRCQPPISSNCTFYQGEKKTCSHDNTFVICKGSTLTDIQSNIFDKICQILGNIDVSEVQIPTCLEEAWAENDLTILNLFDFALEQICVQKEALDTLEASLDTLNPIVDVSLCCCSTSCDNTVVLRLSDALQAIIDCVCEAKAQAKAANDLAVAATSKVTALDNQINNPTTGLIAQIGTLITANLDLQLRMVAVENKTACLPDC